MLSLNSRILIVYTTKMVANIGPDILCQTLKMALGTAANGEKCATAKDAPRPEFCMPTSMAIAFFFAKFIPNIFPNKYPIKYPKQLCKTTTAKIIKPVSAIFLLIARNHSSHNRNDGYYRNKRHHFYTCFGLLVKELLYNEA